MKKTALFAFLLSFGLASKAQAAELGRLFFTPDERQQLDQKFARHETGNEEPESKPFISVNGVIQRSDGSRTVWINGKAQHNAAGKNPNTAPVTVPGKHESIEVKVGQRLLIDSLPQSKADTPPAAKSNN
jgi:hypothetical protein